MPRPDLDPVSRSWLANLTASGTRRDNALADLHRLLLAAVRRQLAARRLWAHPDAEHLACQIADDALMAIVAGLDEYRGESRFTTWAYGFAVNKTLASITRSARRPPAMLLDDAHWAEVRDPRAHDPHQAAERSDLLETLRHALRTDLSERQRDVFVTVALNGVPVEDLAERLSSNRNAVYKTLFDARRKLRASLAAAGYGVLG